jgi:peroxiredoxin Q/BCP
MLENGQPAPNFKLTADDGSEVALSDFYGQRVLLFFYPKAGTSGCTTQACGFRDNYEVFTENNAVVLGISPDTPDKLAKWKAKENFPYLLLSDPDHAVAERYGVWGEKSMYGRKYMGIIRSHFVVDSDGNLEDAQVKISPKKSISEGLKRIKT